MRRTFLFMATLFIASTSLEALSEPSNTAQSSRLAYYISVVKKRFQGKPLTRKEAQTLSSLKKLTVISLAVAGTLGATGLYRLCMGHPTSNGDAAVEEEEEEEEEVDSSSDDEFDYDDTCPDMLRKARRNKKPREKGTGDHEVGAQEWAEGEHAPSVGEKQQVQERCAPFSAADGQDDPEVIPLGSQEVPEGLADALGPRRRRVSHATANNRRRERRRARLEKDSFKPKEPSEDQ